MTNSETSTGANVGVTTSATAPLEELEARLGVRFRDRALLLRALTHHSACPETAQRDAYDTLEFLGDALIGAQVVEHIFHSYPDANEGEMTALKSEVVSRRAFARIGQRLDLMPFICVDVASLRTFNERSRDSLRADVLEAIVGAIHLDAGRAASEAFIAREILPTIPDIKATLGENNPKGALQEHILRQMGTLPRYETLAESGESNDRRFTVGVFAGERLLATGQGTSIKEAGREAARAALRGEQPPGS
jgi:ribonuclease-3